MSNYARPLPSHLRNQSLGGSQQQSPVLLARIAEKKAELANLKDLQALSGGLADQMQMLADKLQTLSDGTEAVAAVLSNWHNVLRAIHMASTKLPRPKEEENVEKEDEAGPPLPQTLVRIPTQHAPAVIEQANAGASAD
ncbi:DASH complex subunit dad2 [Neocucurbitaria cava]|uniref:DASH complex subunit DAD2 n=1 Tax=Neocucurbitaria cava TaxID=798079 RepID=A0A9W8Y1C1_9PLEO|nr:DASH complex subunit dad2 [Neocucurbitaria cava]